MKSKIVNVEFIDGRVQIPEKNLKILKEAAKHPVKYTKDCPKLTKKQLSEFVRYEDFLRDRCKKTSTDYTRKISQPIVQKG